MTKPYKVTLKWSTKKTKDHLHLMYNMKKNKCKRKKIKETKKKKKKVKKLLKPLSKTTKRSKKKRKTSLNTLTNHLLRELQLAFNFRLVKEWTAMRKTKPYEALQLLLKSKSSGGNKQGISTTSASETSEPSKEGLLQELRAEIFDKDLFQAVEANHMIAFKVKNLLNQLNNSSSSESLIEFIVAFGPLLDQVAKDFEEKKRNTALKERDEKLKAEVQTAVDASKDMIATLQAKIEKDVKAVENYEAEIAQYQASIKELQQKIQVAETKKTSILRSMKSQEALDAEINEEAALCLGHLDKLDSYEAKVDKLVEQEKFLNTKLEKAKAIFENLKAKLVL